MTDGLILPAIHKTFDFAVISRKLVLLENDELVRN
jgi:hypothetical protein